MWIARLSLINYFKYYKMVNRSTNFKGVVAGAHTTPSKAIDGPPKPQFPSDVALKV